jgi:hypothetical protein
MRAGAAGADGKPGHPGADGKPGVPGVNGAPHPWEYSEYPREHSEHLMGSQSCSM